MKLFTKRTWIVERVKQRKAKEQPDYAAAERDFCRLVEQGLIYEVQKIGIAQQVSAYAVR